MNTLKRGSKGDDVEVLQHLLNVEGHKVKIDGDYGQKTEAAVKMLQKAHGLEADGIVGPKTWKALGVKVENTSNSKCVDPSVVYSPLKSCITRKPNRAIKYLVIHYTAGASSAPGRAKGMKSSWEAKRTASADFGVDDATLVQFNPDPKNYYCWAVGGGNGITNANSVSIEICSNLKKGANASKANHDGWYFTEASLDNAVKLAKILMRKYNIPVERVVRHYDVTGKICPGVQGWTPTRLYDTKGNKTNKIGNENEWLNFKKRLI